MVESILTHLGLEPQPTRRNPAREHARASTVQQRSHEAHRAVDLIEEVPDLTRSQHDGQAAPVLRRHDLIKPGQLDVEHDSVQEEEANLAWFCVDAATPRSTARWVRNAATSGAPSSLGWRSSWNMIRRRTQST